MKKLCGLFAGAALVAISVAAPAFADTLEDALVVAYRTNPTIQAERARLRATKAGKGIAWGGALPQINGSASYNNVTNTQTINATAFGGVGSQSNEIDLETKAAGVNAELPVFTGFRNFNAIKQASARVRAGGAQLVSTEQQVMREVATAYFDVVRDVAVQELSNTNVTVLLRQLEQADLQFEVGEVTRTDVAQAQARLAGARANLSGAQAQLAFSRAIYAQLVGSAPGTLEPRAASLQLPESLEAAKEIARVYAPALVAAREVESSSRRDVSIAKGALLPTISLTAGYQYAEEPSTFVLQDEQFAYGVRATVPIFQGGSEYARIRRAKALNDADRISIIGAERQVIASVTASWEQLVAARAVIQSAKAQVEANTLALEGVRQEAQVGSRTTLDVLDAEREFLNSNVALVRAERDEYVAAFSLLAAAGVLTPEAIGIEGQLLADDS